MKTRDRLLDAAGDLFYERGFQAVGIDQILRIVGITKTAFYKHFESKEDLILAVLERRDQRDMAQLLEYARQRGGRDPRQQILAFFDHLATWFSQPGFRGCLFQHAAIEFASPGDPIHQKALAHGEHIASELRLRAQAAGADDPESLTRQLMLLVAGAITDRHAAGAGDSAQAARRIAEVLLDRAIEARDEPQVPRPARVKRRGVRRPFRPPPCGRGAAAEFRWPPDRRSRNKQ